MNFDHSAGKPLASLSASASLFIPNFSQNISGSFGADGSYSLRYSGGLTLGTFLAGNAAITLTNVTPHLRASGSFDVRVAGQPLGTVPFAGSVDVGGGYSLLPNGGWNLANFIGLNSGNNPFSSLGSGSGGSLTLTRNGITGNDTLRYGNLDLPINITGCTSSGISFSGSRSVTDDVSRTWDPAGPPAAPCTIPSSPPAPCAELGDVYSGASATVSISANNSGGSFSASASGFWAWWVVVDSPGTIQNPCTTSENCTICVVYPAGYACGSCVTGRCADTVRKRWCADIRNTFDGIPADHKPGFGPISIASDGKIFFDVSHGADGQPVQNGFTFFLR